MIQVLFCAVFPGVPSGPGLVLGALAAIALGVAGSSLARRREPIESAPAGRSTLPRARRFATGRAAGATHVEIALEGGPLYSSEVRFQAHVALPAGFRADASRVRVRLYKISGPDCDVPCPTWTVVPSQSGQAFGGSFVLDGLALFAGPDPLGRRLGDYELEVEVPGPEGRVSGRRRLRVGYAETFRRPAHEVFRGTSSWSITSLGELKGQGPSSGGFGSVDLHQAFEGHTELCVRVHVRYEISAAAGAPPSFELRVADRYGVRLEPTELVPVALHDEHGPLDAGPSDKAPVFVAHGATSGDLRLDFRVRREGDRTRLLAFVDGLLARSAFVPTSAGERAAPAEPWTLSLACRALTVFMDRLEVESLVAPEAPETIPRAEVRRLA